MGPLPLGPKETSGWCQKPSPPSRQGSFYVTTPIYYVNDVPHIGHAYTTVACDQESLEPEPGGGVRRLGPPTTTWSKDMDVEPPAGLALLFFYLLSKRYKPQQPTFL